MLSFYRFFHGLQTIKKEFFEALQRANPAFSVGATPFSIIDEDRTLGFRLLKYRDGSNGKKLLIIPPVVNRPYILDLNKDVSVVKALLDRGFDVYMADWGFPDYTKRFISFSDYNKYIKKALEKIGDASLLGYCTGGVISLVFSSLYPEKIEKIVLLATPVDFSRWYDYRILWGRFFEAGLVSWLFGNVPGEIINFIGFLLFFLYAPFFAVSKEFLEEVSSPEARRDAVRRLRWILDSQMIPGSFYSEFIKNCYKENLLIHGKMRVDSKLVDLGKIDAPILNVLAKYDHIVPLESGRALRKVYRGKEYKEIIFPSSHVGLSVSRKAHRELWPRVADWLRV